MSDETRAIPTSTNTSHGKRSPLRATGGRAGLPILDRPRQWDGNALPARFADNVSSWQRPLTLLIAIALAACTPAEGAPRVAADQIATPLVKFVRIDAGTFEQGSPAAEGGRQRNEGPVRRVTISQPFEMGVHEITNGQFRAFVEDTGYVTEAERDEGGGFGIDFATGRVEQRVGIDWRAPGFPGFTPSDDHPVVLVSWRDAEAFCRWLSRREGRRVRLPSEAEWEYAARAGTQTPWWTGNDPSGLLRAANVADASLAAKMPTAEWAAGFDDGHPFLAPVGSYAPNAWGLHDMHGNVWEWCSDWYDGFEYESGSVRDPQGPTSGPFRTIRGGGWFNGPHQQRSAQRIYFHPKFRYCLLSGFRVVREID